MYAIVRTGGKQYRVEEGRSVRVERLPGEEGAQVELGDVLMIANDGDVTVGTPTIEGARVLAEVEAQGRAKKIIVFKYKSKVRARKKTGHRQAFTQLAVQEILAPGQESKSAAPKRRRAAAKTADEAEEAPAAEAKPEATKDAPEATPKPRAKRASATKSAEKPATRTKRTAAKKTSSAKPKAGKAEAEKKPAPRRRTKRAKDEEKE